MYSHGNAVNAYKQVDRHTNSGRETEARVLTEAALKLKRCQENWDDPNRDRMLDVALRYNQKIWSLFQSELSREDNPLPQKLRVDILRLAAFIDKRIFEIMAYPETDKLNIIIDINRNLAAGLRRAP
ncbi:MAG: flagellar biosynthesis regulator FlaF [Desulfobacterales bacterium]|nr:flagellar biosynthesis regulator FlaF [Desulfobacterales bacterium]